MRAHWAHRRRRRRRRDRRADGELRALRRDSGRPGERVLLPRGDWGRAHDAGAARGSARARPGRRPVPRPPRRGVARRTRHAPHVHRARAPQRDDGDAEGRAALVHSPRRRRVRGRCGDRRPRADAAHPSARHCEAGSRRRRRVRVRGARGAGRRRGRWRPRGALRGELLVGWHGSEFFSFLPLQFTRSLLTV